MEKFEERPGKDTDNAEVEKAIELLYELMSLNRQIEPTLWVSAFFYILSAGFHQCGVPYEMLRITADKALTYYKPVFDIPLEKEEQK
jgi:hypothetical protein